MPPRNLFNDDGDDADAFVPTKTGGRGGGAHATATACDFKVNESWAEKYDQTKRKRELQQLAAKYGKDFGAEEGEGEEGDEEEEEDESGMGGGAEDDDAELITDAHETEFATLLIKLRRNDPDLLNPEVKFFSAEQQAAASAAAAAAASSKAAPAFTLKDEYQRAVLSGGGDDAAADGAAATKSDAELRRVAARTAGEKHAKNAFLDAAGAAKDDAAAMAFAIVRPGTAGGADADADADAAAAAAAKEQRKAKRRKDRALAEAFADDQGDDANEAFLKHFFREERWRAAAADGDGDGDDGYDDDGRGRAAAGRKGAAAPGAEWEQAMKDEQEACFFDDADVWEQEYQAAQYRHQEGQEALKVQTFSRDQQGLLRAKDTTRHDARERRDDRKKETETKVEQDVKRMKHLKRQEIRSAIASHASRASRRPE